MTVHEKLAKRRAETLTRLANWRDVVEDPSAWEDQGFSLPMKIALDFPDEIDLLRDVLSAKPDLTARENASGYTALHFAVQSRSASTVRELLLAGADVNALDRAGQSPLMTALRRLPLNLELIEILLVNGADPALENGAGRTARAILASMEHTPDVSAAKVLFDWENAR
jgi:ankyrin repeat protein